MEEEKVVGNKLMIQVGNQEKKKKINN